MTVEFPFPIPAFFHCMVVLTVLPLNAQSTTFELTPTQSMIISGKGPGQDGAINPYLEGSSYAMVENISENPFEVRIQFKGEIIEIRAVEPESKEQFLLQKGYELYLDTELVARARVEFQEYNE